MNKSQLQRHAANGSRLAAVRLLVAFVVMAGEEWRKAGRRSSPRVRRQAKPVAPKSDDDSLIHNGTAEARQNIASRNQTGRISMNLKQEEAPEPPSCLQSPIFMIGRDSRGNWVAQEQSGMRGGLFVDRAGALKFAKAESGDPHAVVWVSGILELDTSTTAPGTARRQRGESLNRQRRAA
jgi:hypothetical protein